MLHTHTGIPFIGEQKILESDLPSGHTTVNNFSFTTYLGLISRNEFAMGIYIRGAEESTNQAQMTFFFQFLKSTLERIILVKTETFCFEKMGPSFVSRVKVEFGRY